MVALSEFGKQREDIFVGAESRPPFEGSEPEDPLASEVPSTDSITGISPLVPDPPTLREGGNRPRSTQQRGYFTPSPPRPPEE